MRRLFDHSVQSSEAQREQSRRVAAVLERAAGSGEDAETQIATLLAELTSLPEAPRAALALVADALGEEDPETAAKVFAALAELYPTSPEVLAFYGDMLLATRNYERGIAELLKAFALDANLVGLFDEDVADIACSLGGEQWLGYQLAELRSALAAAEQNARADEGAEPLDAVIEPDEIRERYSELLEEYRDDAAATHQIREVGVRIFKLEADGVLPRSFMRRGDWRQR